ncbi:MAG: GtrA family protein [Velocimicrobium sp.]
MINRFTKILKKFEELVTYGIVGVLTVGLNILTFYLLSLKFTNELWANTIAFFIAVQFAYFANTKFVFKDNFTKKNFVQFWGMRIGTLIIDNGGLWLLINCNINTILDKLIINVVIIVLNYIFSKFVIYKKKG